MVRAISAPITPKWCLKVGSTKRGCEIIGIVAA